MKILSILLRLRPSPISAVAVLTALFVLAGWQQFALSQDRIGDRLSTNSLSNFIDIEGVNLNECRQPSTMVTSVQQGLNELPCRQIKVVQHWLNTMMSASTYRGHPPHIGDIAGQPNLATSKKRGQYFFGEWWSTIDEHHDDDKVEDYHSNLTRAFARMSALLIASLHPFGIGDERTDEPWIWELPRVYRNIADPEERADTMRKDVNLWIQKSGLWVYADAGTPWRPQLLSAEIPGDYDFMMSQLIGFMYRFRDHPKLLGNDSIEVLIKKDGRRKAKMAPEEPPWEDTKVPFSGQYFERELFYVIVTKNLAETENHVLMTLAHYFLMNQWIYQGNRGTPRNSGNGNVADAAAWWAYKSGPLHDKLRDVIARTMHQGVFEDNAFPYQKFTFNALLLLATYSDATTIRDEARNALTFLTTKFTFQSLDGRRITPMRRNCKEAGRISPYEGDAMALAINALTGAYKYNDSPYGYRTVIEQSAAECLADSACYWPTYAWKVDDNENDEVGEMISFNAENLKDDFPDAGINQVLVLNALFSGHVIPRALHDFLLRHNSGYFARMMPQYDRNHYKLLDNHPVLNTQNMPGYFDGDVAVDSSMHNERTPEFYFGGHGFLNVAGGIYNSLYEGSEASAYSIPANPYPPLISSCGSGLENRDREQYDYLSRPYTILSEVPIGSASSFGNFYKSTGLTTHDLGEASKHLPLMTGFAEHWWKSTNVATYKNFSYGYRTEFRNFGILAELEAIDPFDLCLTVPLVYKKMDLDFPQKLPPEWQDETKVPSVDFQIEAASFRLYDLCTFNPSQGQAGFQLITARLRKKSAQVWSKRVSRGFWEVVPCGQFADLTELSSAISTLNPESNFSFKPKSHNRHYFYRMATSKEIVKLSQYYGAKFLNCKSDTDNEGRTQGIVGIADHNSISIPLDNVFMQFMNNTTMDRLPLIDVKGVADDYRFLKGDNHSYVQYACAQDGWLAVNNPWDGSYLWVDSRRESTFASPPAYPLPYMESGVFGDTEQWGVSCGPGSGGPGWTPTPPNNGDPHDCNVPSLCPTNDSGGNSSGGHDPPFPDLVPSVQCTGDSNPGGALKMTVTVTNEGLAGSILSATRVVFDDLTVSLGTTPSLASGSSQTIFLQFPNNCTDDCGYTISADFSSANFESNELNNVLQGTCG